MSVDFSRSAVVDYDEESVGVQAAITLGEEEWRRSSADFRYRCEWW